MSEVDVRGPLLLSIARASIGSELGLAPHPTDDPPWLREPGPTVVARLLAAEFRGGLRSARSTRPRGPGSPQAMEWMGMPSTSTNSSLTGTASAERNHSGDAGCRGRSMAIFASRAAEPGASPSSPSEALRR